MRRRLPVSNAHVCPNSGGFVCFDLHVQDPRNVNTVGQATAFFDELRVGTDWASVTPTPEASSFLAFAAVSVVLLGYKLPLVRSLLKRTALAA